MNAFKRNLQELLKYPSAIAGSIIILLLVLTAVYVLATIPYQEAIRLWRGGEDVWYANPQYAPPAWINYFRKEKLPVSFALDTVEANGENIVKEIEVVDENTTRTNITYTFDFEADKIPQEISIYFDAVYEVKQPFVSILWVTPDGREIRVGDFGVDRQMTYRLSQDEKLRRRVGGLPPIQGLFADPAFEDGSVPLKGTYQLVINGISFEPDSTLESEFVFFGQVYGLAGTDHLRRDLMVPLMYGVPIALAFGLLAALGTSVTTMIIAAVGAWYGGWVDELIQRITEINLVLPFLSILIMVGTFYSRSIWTILGVTILLSIFTGGIKLFRAIFMQVKESPYIEAARAYGSSDVRVIFMYLIPRMLPLLLPNLVAAVPSFVFLEASLALLGLGDPVLPTWGKIINDAQSNAALYKGLYYWVLEPAVLLMITGLGFAMLGFALDRVFNPRLRGI